MKQITWANAEFSANKKTTRRERFLVEMGQVVPWATLQAVLQGHYYPARCGRPPVGMKRMLRLYFVQRWYHQAGEAVGDALCDSPSPPA